MIRPATPDDMPTIARLIRGLAAYEKLSYAVEFDETQLREHLFGPRPFAEVLLAEDAGQVVGYALFFPTYASFRGQPGMYLEDLFVEPAHRGQGLGKELLLALARLTVERGCRHLAWVVLDWNTSAIEFYKALGAEAMDEWTVYRLAGDELMQAAKL